MRFPERQRVLYEVNPLTEVICQVRFPPRLGIVAQLPAAFQEAIRHQYPNLSMGQARNFVLGLGADQAGGIPSMAPENFYRFDSADGVWSAILAKDYLTLSTRAYTRWEDFRERWSFIHEVFEKQYGTGSVTRIGLRYQDVIDRNKLGLGDTSWDELIQPYALGLLGTDAGRDASEFQSGTVLQFGEDIGSVLLRTLLGINDQKEKVFVIDADFFADESCAQLSRCDRAGVLGWLDTLHLEAGRAFRWCITDRLHGALKPAPI